MAPRRFSRLAFALVCALAAVWGLAAACSVIEHASGLGGDPGADCARHNDKCAPSHLPVAGKGRLAASPVAACPASLVAHIVADSAGGASPSTILSPSAATELGGGVRFMHAANPTSSEPGTPVFVGGQYRGRGSCDFTLSDNPAAASLADAGARALVRQGLPIEKDGKRGPGEQRYLLRSSAFRDELAYILYIVPDPTSVEPDPIPGAKIYTRNLYAIAVVAADDTVRYAASLVPQR